MFYGLCGITRKGLGKEMLFNSQEHEVEASLTQRQKEFLAAYREHKTTAKAAISLGVAEDTARERLRFIAKKLGFTSIKDLVANELRDKGKARASTSELMDLLRKQRFKCALTGNELTPEESQLDHVIPRSKGGSDAKDNLQWLTSKVNRMKGTLSNEEFIEICGTVWRKAMSKREPLPPIV